MSMFPVLTVAARLAGLTSGLCAASALAADPPALFGAASGPDPLVHGLRAGDWLVRGRIVGTIPTERSSRITVIGGRVDTPSMVLPDVDLSYFLTDHIAIEGQVGAIRTRPVIRNTLAGDFPVGSIWNAAAAGIVQYHVLPTARLNPYLGVGVTATTPLAVDPAPGIMPFKVKSQVSPLIQAGFDYHLSGNWFANAMVKYVFVSRQSYEIAGVSVENKLNMLIVGAGLGYRF